MIKFRYLPIKYNFSERKGSKIEWIVIHDTANHGVGANAYNHYKYFSRGDRKASAHYFVDDKEIVQIIDDSKSAWHCGDNQGHGRAINGCKNASSIGIELCINQDGNYQKAKENMIELVKMLMKKYNIGIDKVCRHYDVSRKRCPSTFSEADWADFKKKIAEPIKVSVDIRGGKMEYKKDVENAPDNWAKVDWDWAKSFGLTDGTRPKDAVTRQEVMALLKRFYDKIKG